MKSRPSPSILRQLLRYEPATGKFFWLHRDRSFFDSERACNSWNARYANTEALTAHGKNDCRQGHIFGVLIPAHQVAWAMHYGEWPPVGLDHEDGKRANNRIGNLRLATQAVNNKNKALFSTNKSGAHGVSFNRKLGKWTASITVNYKKTHLGCFATVEEASAARMLAQKVNGFHANHGRAN